MLFVRSWKMLILAFTVTWYLKSLTYNLPLYKNIFGIDIVMLHSFLLFKGKVIEGLNYLFALKSLQISSVWYRLNACYVRNLLECVQVINFEQNEKLTRNSLLLF